MIGVAFVASLVFSAARAESFVLVYSEGSVFVEPGGNKVSRGDQIDSEKIVQLGPADKAIFISANGNMVCHSGPFRGAVADQESLRARAGLIDSILALFGSNAPAAPRPESCLK
jgi:hypothetical protein